ncbi:MAG: SH3 domain-containing protein [Thermodesulfobacteriota bacterium]
MPQCPICNAAVWVGQQYCSICGEPLPRPEEEDHFCPQCGVLLTTKEEVCQKCQVASSEIAKIPLTIPVRTWKFIWGSPSTLLGAGLIAVALILIFLFYNSSEFPQTVATPPSQVFSGPTSPAPPIPPAAIKPSTSAVAQVGKSPVPLAPAASSSQEETKPTSTPARYFVNTFELSLRSGPTMGASQISYLNFKDEVELLETSGGWGKIRDTRRNIVGWSYMRYLQPLAAEAPVDASQHQPADSEESTTTSVKVSREMPR